MPHPLIERLHRADPGERCAACAAAADDPSAVLLIDALIEALGDSERAVARAASDAIARIGAGQPDVERSLRRALRGDSPAQRWGAAFTLARLIPPEPGWIPAVVEAMAAADGDVRWAAARLLVDMARLDPGVVPVVAGLARAAGDPAARRMAVFCLREIAPDDPATAEALVEATRDEDGSLRRAAFTALAGLIDPPRAVWDRLAEVLAADADPAVRALAAAAAGELATGRPDALPRFVRAALESAAAQGTDPSLQRAAARALARLSPTSRDGIPGP